MKNKTKMLKRSATQSFNDSSRSTGSRRAKKIKLEQKVYQKYKGILKNLLKEDSEIIKGGDIKMFLLENSETDVIRFIIKYNRKANKKSCSLCELKRQCDHTLFVEEYTEKTTQEYDEGEESEYNIVEE